MALLSQRAEYLQSFDLVITAYTLLKGSAVHEARWHRIVLDEGHTVRNPDAVMTVEVSKLRSRRRWILSGTPMPIGVDDLQGQLKCLRMTPYDLPSIFERRLMSWSNYSWIEGVQHEDNEQPLLQLLSSCALRHRLSMIQLPPLAVEERLLEPSAAERVAYETLRATLIARVEEFERGGALNIRKAQLESFLMKLQQACDHPSLARSAGERLHVAVARARQEANEAGVPAMPLLQYLSDARRELTGAARERVIEILSPYEELAANPACGAMVPECTVCLDDNLTPTITPCLHSFCLPCVLQCMRRGARTTQLCGKCPLCRVNIAQGQLVQLTLPEAHGAAEDVVDAPATNTNADPAEAEDALGGTKLDALVAVLREQTDRHPKTVVFTHFTATQKLIVQRLAREGIRYASIAAGATQPQRERAFTSFTSDASIGVFVLHMKQSAFGLTLTSASRLVLLEPGINLAFEAQAIGRVHRFGQTRSVSVVKLGMRATVETKILELNRTAVPALVPADGDENAPALANGGTDTAQPPPPKPVQRQLTVAQIVALIRHQRGVQ